jgi:predicted nucleic acid-binding protein
MVFLDTNVVLEVILKDRPHFEEARKVLDTISEVTAISILTAHLIMHFGRKAQIPDELLEGIINESELLSITAEDYVWAVLNERGKDFEDALQLATAIRNKCSSFITFDTKLTKSYTDLRIKIIIP